MIQLILMLILKKHLIKIHQINQSIINNKNYKSLNQKYKLKKINIEFVKNNF